ncbi:hypothetical protein FB45DRAFT_365149 [Roridomyces roridus]|uniref:Uncharacterized protein n=1 Tax=Roridomyces roridus TaxID=1738132 RepID=A0AAD7C8Z2_9AGAR|nr:hypothetical protein FB45DRAFT_365149 [Roridomyces roridus]
MGTLLIKPQDGKLCLDIGNGVQLCGAIEEELEESSSGVSGTFLSFQVTDRNLQRKLLEECMVEEIHALLPRLGLPCDHSVPRVSMPSIWVSRDHDLLGSYQFPENPFPDHPIPFTVFNSSDGWICDSLTYHVMPNGWTRIHYSEYTEDEELDPEAPFTITCKFYLRQWTHLRNWWLSQYNCVHESLQHATVPSQDPLRVTVVTGVHFECLLIPRQQDGLTLQGTFMTNAPQDEAYLFLFAPQTRELDDVRVIIENPPDTEKYYWASDPDGLHVLAQDIVEDMGLPTVEFDLNLIGYRQDRSLLHDLHVAKGFDPATQDLAEEMGYPLVDVRVLRESAWEYFQMPMEINLDQELDDIIPSRILALADKPISWR